MDTKTKKASKSTEKTRQLQSEGKFALSDLIAKIREAFQEVKGRIDIKFLWEDCGVHRFRVNCWNNIAIQHSEFVRIFEENGKLTVRRDNDK